MIASSGGITQTPFKRVLFFDRSYNKSLFNQQFMKGRVKYLSQQHNLQVIVSICDVENKKGGIRPLDILWEC